MGNIIYDLKILSNSELKTMSHISNFLYDNTTEDGLCLNDVFRLLDLLKQLDIELYEECQAEYKEGFKEGYVLGVEEVL